MKNRRLEAAPVVRNPKADLLTTVSTATMPNSEGFSAVSSSEPDIMASTTTTSSSSSSRTASTATSVFTTATSISTAAPSKKRKETSVATATTVPVVRLADASSAVVPPTAAPIAATYSSSERVADRTASFSPTCTVSAATSSSSSSSLMPSKLSSDAATRLSSNKDEKLEVTLGKSRGDNSSAFSMSGEEFRFFFASTPPRTLPPSLHRQREWDSTVDADRPDADNGDEGSAPVSKAASSTGTTFEVTTDFAAAIEAAAATATSVTKKVEGKAGLKIPAQTEKTSEAKIEKKEEIKTASLQEIGKNYSDIIFSDEKMAYPGCNIIKKRPKGKSNSQRDNNEWILKHTAYIDEIISQELFRLAIPHQQKTRLVLHRQEPIPAFLISKRISGFRPLHEVKEIPSRCFTDLGRILINALWVGETDLNLGNIGIADEGRGMLFKIDGEFTLRDKDNLLQSEIPGELLCDFITPATISSLPYLYSEDYQSHRWFDQVICDQDPDDSIDLPVGTSTQFLSKAMCTHPDIRYGINSAILKIIILPNPFLETFVRSYSDEDKDINEIYNLLIARKEMLKSAAFEDPSFQAYIKSDLPQRDLEGYIEYLKEFKTMAKYRPFTPAHLAEMKMNFLNLKTGEQLDAAPQGAAAGGGMTMKKGAA